MNTYFKLLLLWILPLGVLWIMLLYNAQWYTVFMFPLLLHVQNRYAIMRLDWVCSWLSQSRYSKVIVEVTYFAVLIITAIMTFWLSRAFFLLLAAEVGLFLFIVLPLLLCAHYGKELHICQSYLPGEQAVNKWLLHVREHRKAMLLIVVTMVLVVVVLYLFNNNESSRLPQWGLQLIRFTMVALCILAPLISMLMYSALLTVYECPQGGTFTLLDRQYMSMMGCVAVTLICWVLIFGII